jgi:hypothetical protein
MPLLRRANESSQSEWRSVPEGLWRWIIGKPERKLSEKYGNYQVRFPLTLTLNEQARLANEYGKPDEGIQQSWRTSYTVGLSLGYVDRSGQYKTTKLVDFLAASLGSQQSKKFREWIAQGGGPPRPADLDDQQAEFEAIDEWLGWWDNLEVYGTVRHQDSADGTTTYANFAGPMAVGSLPGQKDDDYQAHGRGKLRAIIAASGETREENHREERISGATTLKRQVLFSEDGDPHCSVCNGLVDIRYTVTGSRTGRCANCKMQLAVEDDQPPAQQFTADGKEIKPQDVLDELPF